MHYTIYMHELPNEIMYNVQHFDGLCNSKLFLSFNSSECEISKLKQEIKNDLSNLTFTRLSFYISFKVGIIHKLRMKKELDPILGLHGSSKEISSENYDRFHEARVTKRFFKMEILALYSLDWNFNTNEG